MCSARSPSVADDLAALTSNANQALGAIAQENDSFDRSLVALPPALRQANTTFVNLRAALDDLDPLIVATGEATQAGLTPFLRKLGTVADESVPVFRTSGWSCTATARPTTSSTRSARCPAQRRASSAIPANIRALDTSQPKIAQLRPYTPDLLAFLARFGQATSNYDGNGHYLRVQPTGINLFRWNQTTNVLDPIPTSEQFADFDNGFFDRCPGGSTQPISGSNPFLDDGNLDGFVIPTTRRRDREARRRHPRRAGRLRGDPAHGQRRRRRRRQLRGPGDLRQRRLPRRWRAGAYRRGERRRGQGRHGHQRDGAGARRR
jgi:hypothetical protein